MRKLKSIFPMTLVALIVVVESCAPKVVSPSESDVSRGKVKYPDLTMAELDQGRALFIENCNLCHGYYAPTDEPADEWNEIVPAMVGKVNQKVGMEKLKPADQDKILKFVVTMSSAQP